MVVRNESKYDYIINTTAPLACRSLGEILVGVMNMISAIIVRASQYEDDFSLLLIAEVSILQPSAVGYQPFNFEPTSQDEIWRNPG